MALICTWIARNVDLAIVPLACLALSARPTRTVEVSALRRTLLPRR